MASGDWCDKENGGRHHDDSTILLPRGSDLAGDEKTRLNILPRGSDLAGDE